MCLVIWAIRRGTLPLPKTDTAWRIVSNLQVTYLPEDAYARSDIKGSISRRDGGYDFFEKVGEGLNNLVKFTI